MNNKRKRENGWRAVVYPPIDTLESFLVRRARAFDGTPVFILGPPRSGTTLFYQALVTRFHSSYFCNYADGHPYWPSLASWFLKGSISEYDADFSSDYGGTRGKGGPAEARKLWSRWFTYDYADEHVDEDTIEHCRRVVANVETFTGAPFVSKNPDHCIRIKALDRTFPHAIYIRVKRDSLDVCRSILNARKNYLGSFEKWFGVRPPEIMVDEDLPVWEQVARQVYYLEKRVDSDFKTVVDSNRQLTVDYRDFCRHPEECFAQISELSEGVGLRLESKSLISKSFQESTGKKLSDQLETGLSDALHRLNDNREPSL